MLTIGKNLTTRTQSSPIKRTQKFQSPQMSSVNFKRQNNHCGDTVHFGSRITHEQINDIQNNPECGWKKKTKQINAIILDGHDTKASIKSLAEIILKDDPRIFYEQRLATEALGQIITTHENLIPEISPYLKEIKTHPDEYVRASIAKSFGKLGDIDELKKMKTDPSNEVRASVAKSFGKLGDIDELKKMKTDTSDEVRASVAKSFGKLGDIDELKKMKTDTNSFVRNQVAASLAKVGLADFSRTQEMRGEITSINISDPMKKITLSKFEGQLLSIKKRLFTEGGLQGFCLNALGVPTNELIKPGINISQVAIEIIQQHRIISPNLWEKLTQQVSKIQLQKNKFPILPR